MTERLSIRTLAAGFTVAGIVLCLVVSFLIALAFPEPPPAQITVAEAQAALITETPPPGWQRRVEPEAPFPVAKDGPGALIQAGLAALMQLPPGDIAVRPVETGGALTTGRTPAVGVLRMPEGSMPAMAPDKSLIMAASFAPFEAAIRQPDGAWRVLTPDAPWITPQRLRMTLAFLVAAAVLVPLAVWGAGRLTAPFLRLATIARDAAGRSATEFVGGPREAFAAAEALDAMRARLGGALRERTAIMAAIAHDLRTPLTGLRLRVEGLQAGAAPAIADIERMERLIAQLLTYVRGEDAPWRIEPLDLADLAKDCVARQTGLQRSATLRAAGEHLVLGDRDQLERVLDNLIENAVLYGDHATVTVETRLAHVICHIVDDGPGIPADQLEAVFSPFHRLETSRNRATGGAGLGLAISRAIITRSGGTLTLTNRPTGGLRAEIVLPRLSPAVASI